ncbi:small multi-drug export protein [Planomicrobium sp. YIM 101495]|uniref:small multi-drug export protein n=1 Tax=Planomicrobium sp. YIM 101495 TaxID=2665160 RepID=UPI0012B83369|nr:small multi-drug export protein [Planomicrobium sp. YIM 101495]MTD29611.1 DNA-binding protein [Planomicrobium sp. YIM 101495]
MIYEYFLVFLGAAIPWLEIALVIPLGIVWGLSPFWVMFWAFVGNMLTVLALIIGFDRFRTWYEKRQRAKGKETNRKNDRAKNIWNKYGLPGLAMLGPVLIGTHIAAFIGMTLGASKRNTTVWMTISIGAWTLAFGILTALGFDFFTQDR